jgi:hypothetical protein
MRVGQGWLGLLSQRQVVAGMGLPRALELSARGQALQAIVADRLQQQQTPLIALLLHLVEQAFI